jgi:transcriptional regulator with XRE-family HTH domain
MAPAVTAGMPSITSAQCKAARKLVGWSVLELARRAGAEPMALSRFEARRGMLSLDKLAAIRSAFENAGVEFPNGAPRLRTAP